MVGSLPGRNTDFDLSSRAAVRSVRLVSWKKKLILIVPPLWSQSASTTTGSVSVTFGPGHIELFNCKIVA